MSSSIYFCYGANEIHFPDHDYAVRFLEGLGYTYSGIDAFEVNEQFKGNIEFWTEEGKTLDFYSDGYEPRLYVGESTDGD